jgi:hypothetical protein
VPRFGRLAARAASASVCGLEVPLLALWVGVAAILSFVTAQVRDWNAMTDELVYERLAISVWQSRSLLPHLHGELIRSLAQLYPALISPFFSHGYVPENLRNAHIFNAWLMSSACIPAFLLARRVAGRRFAYLIALVTVCTPWLVYSTTLLTEVAAYPAFLWAILAMHKAAIAPRGRNDLLALLGLVFAVLARTQFVGLVAVLPAALVVFHLTRPRPGPLLARLREGLKDTLGGHVLLACAYVVLAAGALVTIESGRRLSNLSVYGAEDTTVFHPGWVGSVTGHLADLAFGIGILPLLVGSAWLVANVLRPPAGAATHAFACIGSATLGVIVLEISSWDLGTGTFVIDRFLYYLAPILLLAFVCALLDRRRPRFSLLVPVGLVAWGYARHLQADFLWSGRFPLSTDSPIATLYKPIADLGGGKGGASAILVGATIVLSVGFVLADRLVRPALLTSVFSVVLLIAFPVDTVYTFAKLFSRDGHSYRPLTKSESGILDWLDRAIGTDARVTEVPYPISDSFIVSQEFWRDLEFWNKSVRYAVHYPTPDVYRDAVIWFPDNAVPFDPATGAASKTLTPYVVQSVGETRFRVSGTVVLQPGSVMVIKTAEPWRTDWLTSGLYDDGWTRPDTPAVVRVFAAPGQKGAVQRTLTLQLRSPADVASRDFTIGWAGGSLRGTAGNAGSVSERVELCVPAGGYADVQLETPDSSTIPGDLRSQADSGTPRQGGLLVAGISLADEIGGRCRV